MMSMDCPLLPHCFPSLSYNNSHYLSLLEMSVGSDLKHILTSLKLGALRLEHEDEFVLRNLDGRDRREQFVLLNMAEALRVQLRQQHTYIFEWRLHEPGLQPFEEA